MNAAPVPSLHPDERSEHPPALTEATYAALRRLAHRRMAGAAEGSTIQPTALVHEAWLRLSHREKAWEGQSHFLAGAAIAMRQILIDHARRKTRQRRGGSFVRSATVNIDELARPDPDERLLLIDEGVQALEAIDPLGASVVVSRFFGGLNTGEIADSLGISERSVDRHWATAKVWLYRWMQRASSP